MNPFDLKSALLAKHAQHVVLIHFPIALFLAGAGFDLAARWAKQAANRMTLATVARVNILAAAAFVLPTLITGILAWQFALEGEKLKGLLLLHLILGCCAGGLICLVAWMHLRQIRNPRLQSFRLPLELFTVVVVGLAAHVGGFVSGINIG